MKIGKHTVLTSGHAQDAGPFGVGAKLDEAASRTLDDGYSFKPRNRAERRFRDARRK